MAELRDEKSSVEKTEAPDSDVDNTVVNDKALLRKIDARLLPAVGVLYLLSFLDRSNGACADVPVDLLKRREAS